MTEQTRLQPSGKGPSSPASADDRLLVARLLAGDEEAFLSLVADLHSGLSRLARAYVRKADVAEEVVQQTWLAVLAALPRFQFRSRLKTWVFSILLNQAKRRASDDRRRHSPGRPPGPPAAARVAVPPTEEVPEGWRAAGAPQDPEAAVLTNELRQLLEDAIDRLSRAQRTVLVLRDIEGWDAEGVCELLQISSANQRVLLHRARLRLRALLSSYLRQRDHRG